MIAPSACCFQGALARFCCTSFGRRPPAWLGFAGLAAFAGLASFGGYFYRGWRARSRSPLRVLRVLRALRALVLVTRGLLGGEILGNKSVNCRRGQRQYVHGVAGVARRRRGPEQPDGLWSGACAGAAPAAVVVDALRRPRARHVSRHVSGHIRRHVGGCTGPHSWRGAHTGARAPHRARARGSYRVVCRGALGRTSPTTRRPRGAHPGWPGGARVREPVRGSVLAELAAPTSPSRCCCRCWGWGVTLEEFLCYRPCGGVAHRRLRLSRRRGGRRHAAGREHLSVDELLRDELLQASEVRPKQLHIIVPRPLRKPRAIVVIN